MKTVLWWHLRAALLLALCYGCLPEITKGVSPDGALTVIYGDPV